MSSRPTLKEIQFLYRQNVKGRQFFCPKQKNKGKAGLLLEGLLGIPQSSACLDCYDGELKAFPQIKASTRSRLAKQYNIPKGEYIAKETVAITMMKPSELPSTSFEASRLYKKSATFYSHRMCEMATILNGTTIPYLTNSTNFFKTSRQIIRQYKNITKKMVALKARLANIFK